MELDISLRSELRQPWCLMSVLTLCLTLGRTSRLGEGKCRDVQKASRLEGFAENLRFECLSTLQAVLQALATRKSTRDSTPKPLGLQGEGLAVWGYGVEDDGTMGEAVRLAVKGR